MHAQGEAANAPFALRACLRVSMFALSEQAWTRSLCDSVSDSLYV
jgi:hypothetical protein